MNIKWYMSDVHACGYIRGEVMARQLNQLFPNHRIDCKTDLMLSDYPGTNLMVFQRQEQEAILRRMVNAKQRSIKTICEMDDDMFNIPEHFEKPYDHYADPEVQRIMAEFLKQADAVTVATYPLAEALQKHCNGNPIYVVENALDIDYWSRAYEERMAGLDDVPTIGWFASGSHSIDAPLVTEALAMLMEEIPELRLHFIGWIGFADMGPWSAKYKDRIKIDNWIPIAALPHAMIDFDVGIAPLVDNPFNRSKSNIKWQQFSSLCIPCVASPLPPYDGTITHGETGMLAEGNTPGSWYECLKKLVTDKAFANKVGMAARKKLVLEYDIRNNVGNWVEVFERVVKG